MVSRSLVRLVLRYVILTGKMVGCEDLAPWPLHSGSVLGRVRDIWAEVVVPTSFRGLSWPEFARAPIYRRFELRLSYRPP